MLTLRSRSVRRIQGLTVLGVTVGLVPVLLARVVSPQPEVHGSSGILNVRVNDRAGEPVGRVQSEVTLAVRGDTLVAAWNDSEGQWGTGSLCGHATSIDRGATWVDGGDVPDGPLSDLAGDPALSFLPDGTWIHAAIDLGNDDGIGVSRGRMAGDRVVWDPPLLHQTGGGELLEKPYVDVDPETGAIYLAYVNWSQNRGELVRSDDGGVTWSAPLEVFHSSRALGYTPAVGVDGTVFVVWTERVGEPDGEIYVRRSRDGGASFDGPPVRVTALVDGSQVAPRCYDRERNPTFASIAVDRSPGPHRGAVMVTWTDGPAGGVDAMFARSTDDGDSWSDPLRLHQDPGTEGIEQFWPSVHVGPDGRVSVAWFDRRHDDGVGALTDVYLAQSVDGGQRFGPDRRISDRSVPWCGIPADFIPAFGDYIDVVSDDRSVWVGWADARDGDPDVIVGRVDDVRPVVHSGALGRWWPLADAMRVDGLAAPGSGAGLLLALLATPGVDDDLLTRAGGTLEAALTLGSPPDTTGLTGVLTADVAGVVTVTATATDPLPPELAISVELRSLEPGLLDLTGTIAAPGEALLPVAGRLRAPTGGVMLAAPLRLAATTEWTHQTPVADGGARVHLEASSVPRATPWTLEVRTSVEDETPLAVDPVTDPVPPAPPGRERPTLRVLSPPGAGTANVVLTLPRAGRVELEVFEIGGRLLHRGGHELGVGAHRLEVEGPEHRLPPGVHLVRVTVDDAEGRVRLMQKLVRLRPPQGG